VLVALDDGKFPWLKTSAGMKMDLERDFLPFLQGKGSFRNYVYKRRRAL
jgi:hypothetical protein